MHKTLLLLMFVSTVTVAMEVPDGVEKITQGFDKKSSITSAEDDDNNNLASIVFPQAHFSPRIGDVIKNLISNERKRITGAIYRFTLFDVAKKLVEKKKSNINSLFVVNKDFQDDSCAAIRLLRKNKIGVYQQDTPLDRIQDNEGYFDIMHHKFLIFSRNSTGKPLLVTGSFNFTGQANNKNAENIIILDDAEIIKQFRNEFKLLKANSSLIPLKKCTYTGRPKSAMGRRMSNIPPNISD